jgi:hypothetical protein
MGAFAHTGKASCGCRAELKNHYFPLDTPWPPLETADATLSEALAVWPLPRLQRISRFSELGGRGAPFSSSSAPGRETAIYRGSGRYFQESNMKKRFSCRAMLVLGGIVLWSVASFAVPVRGASKNGVDANAPFWNLWGPTAGVLDDSGDVLIRSQVLCTNSQVAAAQDNTDSAHAGSCLDGAYTFLFQLQSKAKHVTVVLDNLIGFTPDANSPIASYGVELCDTEMNTLQLCTTATADQLPNIKTVITTTAKKSKIKFVIPKFPDFPAGTASQGQGITLVVTTVQTDVSGTIPVPLPIAYPKLTIK